MLNIPESLRNILKQDYLPYHAPVEKSLVLYFADLGLTITDEDFTDGDSFSLEDSLCGDELTFGDCGSACLKFKVDNIIEDLVGKKFTAKFVIENTDIKLGTFIVTEAKKDDDDITKSIVAYDLMYLFNKDVLAWYDGLSFPMSLKAFRNSLCTYCGVEFVDSNLPNDTMNVEKTISTNILYGREVLNKCEELNGCFGHMNRDGKLDHIILSKSNPVETITDVSYDTLKFEEYTTDPISKVQIRAEDGDIGAYVGTGTNCYSITANYLVYGKTAAALSTICTNLSTNILGVTYRPYESDMQGLPYLNIGDLIKFEGNETANTYIMQRTLSGTQILTDKTSAKGSKTLSEDNNINVQMEQMKGKTNVLTRDVEKMESTITEFDKQINVLLPGPWYPDSTLLPCQNNMTNLEYELNSKILQTAKEITTEVNNVSEQLNSQISQTATSITAQVNDLSANMSSQFTQTATEISTKVEKNGVISAINQTAESITINASKINLTGYATFSGLESGTTVINGGCIKTGSIDAERIKAGKLNGMTLSGANIDCYMLKSSSSSSSYTELTAGNLEVYTAGYRTSIDGTGISIKGRSVLCYGDSVSSVATSYLTLSGGTLVADNGSLYIGQNTVKANTITQTSSRKLKKHIKNFKESALDIINKTEVKTYLYKNENKSHKRHVGVIMEDVNEIIVNQEKSGIDIGAMTSLSWKAIQELEDRICKLEQT